MIKTIIFDLGEVYLQGMVGLVDYLREQYGLSIEDADFDRAEIKELFEGKITEDKYWELLLKDHDWDLSIDDLKQAARAHFQEIKGTREIIEALRKEGYRLGLLSVHTKEWIDHLEKTYDYHKLFDAVSYSFEEAVSKPDQRAYEIILRKLNAEPSESLFIDDNSKNVEAAEEIGIKGIVFQHPEQLRKDLEKWGINLA